MNALQAAERARDALIAARLAAERRPCDCGAYFFPHRPGSGECNRDAGDMLANYCADCGGSTHMEDHGIGPNEFWGAFGCDTDVCETCDWCLGTDIREVVL